MTKFNAGFAHNVIPETAQLDLFKHRREAVLFAKAYQAYQRVFFFGTTSRRVDEIRHIAGSQA